MRYDPLRHHRRSLRLAGYDYLAEGAYSVTICTRKQECMLGEVVDREMILSEMGKNVEECWLAIPNDLRNVGLDEYQIMPNHIHGIIVLWGGHAVISEDSSLKDLSDKKGSVRDLINQIPPGGSLPLGNQIPPGDSIASGHQNPPVIPVSLVITSLRVIPFRQIIRSFQVVGFLWVLLKSNSQVTSIGR